MGKNDGKHNESESPLWYFFLGGVLGTAATMLFAPKSGRRTREFIGEKASEGKEAVERGMESLRGQAHRYREKATGESKGFAEKGKDLIEKEKEIIAAAVEAGIRTYKEKRKSCD